MADSMTVNSQVTDAVTQANLTNVGQAPAMAIGMLSQAAATSLATMMANAVASQNQMNVIAQAATARGVALITGEKDD